MYDRAVSPARRRKPCDIQRFLLNQVQLGTGASGVTASPSLTLLGNPLDKINLTGETGAQDRDIYANEDTLLAYQSTLPITSRGLSGDKLVTIIRLEEGMLNGHVLDEIGLLVDNPFNFLEDLPVRGSRAQGPILSEISHGGLGAGSFTDGPRVASYPEVDSLKKQREAPGSMLAAYRKFPAIKKEPTFQLLFRWSITFKPNC